MEKEVWKRSNGNRKFERRRVEEMEVWKDERKEKGSLERGKKEKTKFGRRKERKKRKFGRRKERKKEVWKEERKEK